MTGHRRTVRRLLRVVGGLAYQSIGVGGEATCGIAGDGSADRWGWNEVGRARQTDRRALSVQRSCIVSTFMPVGDWRPGTPWLPLTGTITMADEVEGDVGVTLIPEEVSTSPVAHTMSQLPAAAAAWTPSPSGATPIPAMAARPRRTSSPRPRHCSHPRRDSEDGEHVARCLRARRDFASGLVRREGGVMVQVVGLQIDRAGAADARGDGQQSATSGPRPGRA